jgi:hypothetical protein
MDSPMDKIHPGPHHAPDDLTDQAADLFAVAVFPNPGYRPSQRPWRRRGGARNGTVRGPGAGWGALPRSAARVAVGLFHRSRRRQLRRLATWMDSHNDLADPSGRDDGGGAGLRVVTGNSGVGKSALLGVLVCAAHPRLRESTQQLWWVAAHRPSQNPHLAAVHAHQRGVAEITASLGGPATARLVRRAVSRSRGVPGWRGVPG